MALEAALRAGAEELLQLKAAELVKSNGALLVSNRAVREALAEEKGKKVNVSRSCAPNARR